MYRSKFEQQIATWLQKQRINFEYESHSYMYMLKIYRAECMDCNGSDVWKKHWYTPDFFLENGVVVEAKGKFTAKDRKIIAAMKEQHPELDLRVLFTRNNKISPKSKTRYLDWCERREIKCDLFPPHRRFVQK